MISMNELERLYEIVLQDSEDNSIWNILGVVDDRLLSFQIYYKEEIVYRLDYSYDWIKGVLSEPEEKIVKKTSGNVIDKARMLLEEYIDVLFDKLEIRR